MLTKDFIELGREASVHNNDSGSLAKLEQRFLNGERRQDFLKAYITKRTEMKLPNADMLNTYLKFVPKDQLSRNEEIVFLGKNIGARQSAAVDHVLSGLPRLTELQKKDVSARLFSLFSNEFGIARKEKRLEDQYKIIKQMEIILSSVTTEQMNTANLIKLLYFTETKDRENLKRVSQSIAQKLMAVKDEDITIRNLELYNELMEPFISGERDSTSIPGFSEEAKRLQKQHSAEIASRLYQVSDANFKTLSQDDPALNDALKWAERAHALTPNEATQKLVANLRAKVGG
ncbi:hypothetical protein [Pedobacter frigidisoli]|uniref:hypothetical protein n=1 Tax=Pedobacter frigidisoli TaxID=2530455 RepID=UPI002931D904|nr:hypothetical protein [Pedobacter frigidisoli]